MKLTEIIVRRPVSAVVIIIGIVVFGIMSILGMPQELTPEMNMPILLVSTVYPGAGPEDVEKLITQEVEGAVGSLGGVDTVSSYSMENVSMVIMQYEYGTNMDIAYTDVKDRLDRIVNTLPETAQRPIVLEMDMNAMESLSLSVRSATQTDLLGYVNEEIVPEFEKLSTVADVSVSGGRERYIRVELLEDRMKQYGITMSSITSSIAMSDFSMPTGSADFGSQSLTIRSSAEYRTIEALQNIPLSTSTGGIIRLGDVANVYHNLRDASSISRYNGEENVGIGIQKRQSATAVSVSRQVRQVVDEINAANNGVHIDISNDNSESIQSSINSVSSTLLLSIALSMLVLFIFLGDFKASLIIGSSMPVSLLVTFILMDMMGFSTNIVTMSAMVLGVGMMVDNSIVVIDSCFIFHTKERTFIESAIEGTRFVMGSIGGSTFTTIIVFFPLAVLKGLSGQLFLPLGFTIIFSLTASLLSAITLVPLFFAHFQPVEKQNAPAARWLKRTEDSYAVFLEKILKKKKLVTIISVGLVVVSLLAASQLNTELMPEVDQGIVVVSLSTRPGLKNDKINEMALELEAMVAAHPDVERYSFSSGGSGMMISMGGGGGTGGASVTAYLKKGRAMETWQVVEQWRDETKNFVGADVTVSASSMTSALGNDTIQVNLQGNDLDNLRDFSEQIIALMKEHPDMVTVTSSMSNPSPQAEIVVDPLLASAAHIPPMLVASSINEVFSGRNAATVRQEDQSYEVWVEYPDDRYQDINDLTDMILTSPTGAQIPLLDIATIEFSDSPQTIVKQNNQYQVTITGTPRQVARFSAEEDIATQVNALEFPRGIEMARSTAQEMMNSEFAALGRAILIATLLVFMVMAIQFESIRYSLMVMICIPFSMIGSFGLLFVAGETISMTSLLGFLILIGTVVNNGILFVDTTNAYRQTMPVETALIHTGRTRLRPILMTTLTTILSMLPLSLGIGEGTEMMQGLGYVVIGGLTVSTLLTLLLLPTFYLMLAGNQDEKTAAKKAKKEARRRRREAEDEAKARKEESAAPLVEILSRDVETEEAEPEHPKPPSGKEY